MHLSYGPAVVNVCYVGLMCWGRLVDWVSDSRLGLRLMAGCTAGQLVDWVSELRLGLRLMAGCTARTRVELEAVRESVTCVNGSAGGLRFLVIW